MNKGQKSLSINETFIIEPENDETMSACTGFFTSALISCSGNTQILLGTDIIEANSAFSATTFYGDGSNLTGVAKQDTYITGGTYSDGTSVFTNNTGGTFSVTGFTTPFTGGTVYGPTSFTNGLTATTISATTYENLPLDIRVTGVTKLNSIAIFTNNSGGTFTLTGLTDTFISGVTIDNSNYDLTLYRNDGVNLTTNLGVLSTDIKITGGTYDINTGVVTFTNNTGGTFSVTGFTSGMTDSYTTGATLNGNIIEFGNNLLGPNYYNINLTPLISGFSTTDIRVTGGTYSNGTTVFTNNTGGTFSVTGFTTPFTGGTVNGLTATTISATTYENLPTPTLQQVLDFNHDLVNGVFNAGTDAGDFNTGVNQNAMGQEAGIFNEGNNQNALGVLAGAGNSADNQNAMGYNAGLNNTALNQNAFGSNAGAEQRGDNQNAMGEGAGYDNAGDNQNAFGNQAGFANQGINQNAMGNNAGSNNTGDNVNAFGEGSCQNNVAVNVNAFGNGAGDNNTFRNVNLFGERANATADGQTVLAKDKNTMARINTSGLTADRQYDLQDKSGTIAFTGDIPTNTSQLVNDGEDGTSPYVTLDQLPSNLSLFATNASSDIGGYFKLVTSIDDPDYNTTPVDISTGAITTTGQFIASLATEVGVLIGNPGIINLTTVGNVRRTSGTGTAEFYYEVYHRNSGGTETLIATSNTTPPVSTAVYTEFIALALLNNGTFLETDRIVVKYYADRIIGDSDPSYEFQFGGTSPVRTTFPVPASNLPFSLDTLSDVNISGATSGDILVYNDTSDEWENQSPNFIEKSVGPTYTTNSLITVTQAEYDAIITKDDTKIYFIV